MRRRPEVPAETLRLQALASNPAHSAWVSANAGSGKTHVLAQRVVRLLLDGTDPGRILCLTYTRAAAANMSNRVFGILAGWTALDDDTLARAIAEVDGGPPDRERLKRARRLFADALETPGGLKIQTIHAFCEAVLQRFSLEAGVPARFEMLDSAMEAALLAEARRALLAGAADGDEPELAEAFAAVLERAGEAGLDRLLGDIMARREGLRSFIGGIAGTEPPFRLLYEEFGFAAGKGEASIAAACWPLPGFDAVYIRALAANAEAAQAARVLDKLAPGAVAALAETDPVARLDRLSASFFTQKGERFAASTFKNSLLALMPDLPDCYDAACTAIEAARDRLALLRMLKGTHAALTLASRLIARYEALKARRGFLDFNDLVERTANLLARTDAAAWVQYKLDQGLDHILLDEAQDTSAAQWAVVRGLIGEFFSGRGARDGVRRTVFAVGDEKQSIYSFQGAAPEVFAETGVALRRDSRAAGRGFQDVRLHLSFRSTRDVLSAVDNVFAAEDVRRGVSASEIRHAAVRDEAPGHVELWESVADSGQDDPDDWTESVDANSASAVVAAGRVAETIAGWLRSGELLESQGRPVRPGDILVLVRKRDRFVRALSRGLKDRGVAVAGADRLSLPAHIAVKDLAALGRYLVQPEDDLSLAAVLKSPIFGMDEDFLYDIAAGRPAARSLGEALRQRAEGSAAHRAVVDMLDRWATEAAYRPVFEFYAGILGPDGVRRHMIARLGPEAGEILDEFLGFCLAEERVGLPGLQAFLATLESAPPEIRREMAQGRDEVRIMTVHAAKGLEAPIVFLVDGGAQPFADQHLPRLLPFRTERIDWKGQGYFWRWSSEVVNGPARMAIDRLRRAGEDEYRRLLYVGMTRAEDRLIVCGYHGKKRNPATWHALVERALSGLPETQEIVHSITGAPVLRYRVTTPSAAGAEDEARPAPLAAPPLPGGLAETLPPDDDMPSPLSPSGASLLVEPAPEAEAGSLSPVFDAGATPGPAAVKGVVVHRLLQSLPDLPPPERAAAAERYLARAAAGWSDAERETVRAGVATILSDLRFAALFAPGSRAEVAVSGQVEVRGRLRTVSGVVDRIAVSETEVLIVDYKTNRVPPASAAEVPLAYVLQLALYRVVLGRLYPGRAVCAALLYTEAPRLIELTTEAMDAALARLTRAV